MEADFTRYYHEDLRALCWGSSRWGVRRLLAHVKYLPRDSAYVRSLSGERAYWDEQAELTARVYDSIERLTYYTLRVNGTEVDPPELLPRPGVVAPADVVLSLTQFNDFLKG